MMKKIEKNIVFNRFVVFLFSSGIILRLSHYFENRSLWLDEAWLSLRILALSFRQIILGVPFDVDFPVPPVAFLLFEKSSVYLFGNSEASLRFFPLICGILSIFLFYNFLKKNVQKESLLLAFALFVFCDVLIYYSAEVKQYSSDVWAALMMYLIMDQMNKNTEDYSKRLFFGMVGVALIFLSHPVVFILAGIGISQIYDCLKKKKKEKFYELVKIYFIWGLGFAFFYFKYCKGMLSNPIIFNGAKKFFLPGLFWEKESIFWVIKSIKSLYINGAGVWPAEVSVILSFLGVYSVWMKDPQKCLAFIFPFVLVFFAACFQKYPFWGRFVLFLLPGLYVFISEGVTFLVEKMKNKKIIKTGLISFILLPPLVFSVNNTLKGRERENLKKVMSLTKVYFSENDTFYVNDQGVYAFLYYFQKNKLPFNNIVINRFSDKTYSDEKGDFLYIFQQKTFFNKEGFYQGNKEITELKKKYLNNNSFFNEKGMVWFVFSHYKESKKDVLKYIKNKNEILINIEEKGAHIIKY